MCVEDNQNTASLIEEARTELSYTVELAPEGRGALAHVLAQRPDLVLDDPSMRRVSGFELLETMSAPGPAFGRIRRLDVISRAQALTTAPWGELIRT
jgi:CheY-like chemotaxis protein